MLKDFDSTALVSLLIVAVASLSVASVSTAWPLSEMTEDELSDISGREGIVVDFHGKISMENIKYTDSDGNGSGSTGEIQLGDDSPSVGVALGSISNTNGDLTAGNVGSVNLTGLTFDSDGAVTIGGSTTGGVVVGMPNGTFDFESDNIFVGDPASTSNTFQLQANGIDVSNTTVEIGAKN